MSDTEKGKDSAPPEGRAHAPAAPRAKQQAARLLVEHGHWWLMPLPEHDIERASIAVVRDEHYRKEMRQNAYQRAHELHDDELMASLIRAAMVLDDEPEPGLRYYQRRDEAVYGHAVHVHKGRRLHRALNGVRTLCGQSWVATYLDDATLPPDCSKCRHEMGLA